MLVFGLNSGAHISEIMRSGIQSVDARADGSRTRQWDWGLEPAWCKIVIPQAVKNILPTLGNEFISLYQGNFRRKFRRRG